MRLPVRWTAPALAFALAVLVPRASLACAVCTSGRADETRLAFLVTTGFLTVLPLALVGGFVYWLRRRARELAEAEARAELAPARPALSRRASSP